MPPRTNPSARTTCPQVRIHRRSQPATAMSRSRVLSLYRQLIRHASDAPKDHKAAAVAQIRSEFRSNRGATSGEECEPATPRADPPRPSRRLTPAPLIRIEALIERAESRLAFIRISSPRRPKQQGGPQVFTVGKDGKVHEGSSARRVGGAVQGGYSVTSEDLRRHQALLQRQHFMSR